MDYLLKVTSKEVKNAAENLYSAAKKENHQVIFCDKSKKIGGNIIQIPL